MPNFKPKANKKFKISKKQTTTLDNKHYEKMCEFENIEKKLIPMWKGERKALLQRKKNIQTIEEKLRIEDAIKELNSKIKKNRIVRKEYLLQNSQYILIISKRKKNYQQE